MTIDDNNVPGSDLPPPGTTRLNVILIGMMGSGKTSTGRPLAGSLGFGFLDTDQLVVKQAQMSIPGIFAKEKEEGFRKRETELLRELVGVKHHVISTGGGVVIRPGNRSLLRTLGFVVWLTADMDVLYNRVRHNRERPLLHTRDPRRTLEELAEARAPLYRETAHLTVDTTTLSSDETVHGIVDSAHYFFARQAARL